MGKKKDKHRHDKGGDHEAREGHASGGGHKVSGAAAGIAAMALAQVKSQLDTPAGRQAMAAGLRLAADALAPKAAPTPPRTPEPPAPPRPAEEPNPYAANPAEPPHEPTPPPRPDLPPEVARVIGTVAAGLEKWAAKLGVPKG